MCSPEQYTDCLLRFWWLANQNDSTKSHMNDHMVDPLPSTLALSLPPHGAPLRKAWAKFCIWQNCWSIYSLPICRQSITHLLDCRQLYSSGVIRLDDISELIQENNCTIQRKHLQHLVGGGVTEKIEVCHKIQGDYVTSTHQGASHWKQEEEPPILKRAGMGIHPQEVQGK